MQQVVHGAKKRTTMNTVPLHSQHVVLGWQVSILLLWYNTTREPPPLNMYPSHQLSLKVTIIIIIIAMIMMIHRYVYPY